MKVHSSQSSYSAPLLSQSYTDSDDDTPFVLPDDEDSSEKKTAPSISSAGVANSISSFFWQSQSGGSTTDATTAAAADGTDATDSGSAAGSDDDDDILSQFSRWADMTPADKIRSQYLEQQNMTEEQFSQLPADQQKAINDQIASQIKQQAGASMSATGEDESDGGSAAVSLG
ncbi:MULTISPECIES: hypothetical protein [unclassified Rhizobium]|uniref:hypothetical protein n=1 Tax=unclassified Rhizobium TaxID=2613769 RepID=UPI001ADB673E|nr:MULTISPECIES: hypothetical protein [unclassified Rhizobium]MBO9097763.1 hypothetical protein [Rhizobium sp. L58/93]MBO9133454.1 hypothetical protein [Rhizobium sp. B209b/85]MBO9167913.1 hypothetical protein [Rhizobium sp. L245/93]MBO9183958.1 hypothetical protein [Rhizobium sp. E27B/91]QXZ84192.1 hypothetical protein J5287_01085 [Rhizobium sp. K1/93]